MNVDNGNVYVLDTNSENSDNYVMNHEETVDDVFPQFETRSDINEIVELFQENGTRIDSDYLDISRSVDNDKMVDAMVTGSDNYIVKCALQAKEGPYIYKMVAKVRGKLILVNNYIFDEPSAKQRHGCQNEGEYLSTIFEKLGFEVVSYKNISAMQMVHVFHDVSVDESLVNHDALIVMIMTYGEKGFLMGSDCKFAIVENIIGLFNNYHCTQLIHKPKMFFIQAFPGGGFDYSARDAPSAADAVPRSKAVAATGTPILPTFTDMLICYPSVEDSVSLRKGYTGFWFEKAFGSVLVDHACDDDLETLLKRVNNRMLRSGDSLTSHPVKQPLKVVLRSWLTLYFNPEIYEC